MKHFKSFESNITYKINSTLHAKERTSIVADGYCTLGSNMNKILTLIKMFCILKHNSNLTFK